jgi:hypothetical protein
MERRRVFFALICGALSACSTTPSDVRAPTEITSPTPDDWRGAAQDLADDIAQHAEKQGISEAASVAPLQGSAPPYFRDLLLANLLDRGVRVAEQGTPSVRIACRITPIGITPYPRGLTRAPATLRSEILALCLLERDGAYVAAARHVLPVPEGATQPAKGIVMEVKE